MLLQLDYKGQGTGKYKPLVCMQLIVENWLTIFLLAG